MIDLDRLTLRAEMSIKREEELFVEYTESNHSLSFHAIFSLKHRNALLSRRSTAFDFVENVQNRVMAAMARKLGSRLFLVLHGDNARPPFEFWEVNLANATADLKATIHGQTEDAWQSAYRKLGILKD